MTGFLKVFLPVYFLLFLAVAVLWRNWVVYHQTGESAFKLHRKNGPEKVTSGYFKIIPVVIGMVLIIYVSLRKYYTYLGPLEYLEHTFLKIIGVMLMITSFVIVICAQSQMGASWRIGIDNKNKTRFVAEGLFRYSRNPIFTGAIICAVGFFLVLPNAVTLSLLVMHIISIQVQVSLEEQHLSKTHGESYEEYCRKVRRWI